MNTRVCLRVCVCVRARACMCPRKRVCVFWTLKFSENRYSKKSRICNRFYYAFGVSIYHVILWYFISKWNLCLYHTSYVPKMKC
jgi:hypothetical protein